MPHDASVPAPTTPWGAPEEPRPHTPPGGSGPTPLDAPPESRRRIGAEIWIVLGLSLGKSAVYAVISLVAMLTAGPPLAEQSTSINASQSPRPYLDLTYQLVGIAFVLLPVALAFYLLSAHGRSARARLGLDVTRPWRDLGWGVALAASIGIPGLAFYVAGRALGITVEVQASALDTWWWTIPVLVLAAFENGVVEEVIVVGYLRARTLDLGWNRVRFIVVSSILRGSYHLYQGFGPFLGNVVMGVVFSWFYTSRWGRHRVAPLVIAHTLIDIVAFVGYALLPAEWRAAMGLG